MKRLFILAWAVISLTIASCDKADTSAIEARLDAVEKVSIASLQSQMSQINTTIGNLQATQSQLSGFVTNLRTSVGTLEGNYSSLNTEVDNLGKQNSKFEKDIADLAKAVDDCGKDVKKWVEESYTTLTKFSELQGEVSTIKTNIQTIFSRLDGLDSETKRISDGLRDLSTELNEKLGKCEGEIEGIKKDLKALQDDMDSVKAQIAAIVSSVQSVVVVPDYSDGSVKMTNSAENLIRFEIYPLEAASKLASLGASAISLDFIETATKAGALANIPVSKVSFDGEFFTVTANGNALSSNIQTGESGANARLRISDGTITRSSEFFRLTFDKAQSDDVIIELLPLSGLTEMHATLNAQVNCTVKANDDMFYGFVYSESKDNLFFNREFYPVADTLKTRTISKDGVLSCTTHTLNSETKYYYRPFVIRNDVAYYGDAAEFTTLAIDCTIETLEATDVSDFEARLSGKLTVNSQENLAKEHIGFLYSKTATTLEEFQSACGTFVAAELENDGTFKSEPILDYNTTYYYVAVATVHSKAFYGEVKSFTTQDKPAGAVDLGIVMTRVDGTRYKLYWGTSNIGASKPEEYGDYYAWGEIDPYYSSQDPLTWKDGKTGYNWASYNWCNGSYDKLTKYCPTDRSRYWDGEGSPDGKTVLDPEDDVAHVKLGGNWRIPTYTEWIELINKCTWTRTTQNGVTGRLVTSRTNGNSIFLPAAGYRSDTELSLDRAWVDPECYYWSSSLDTYNPYGADNYSSYESKGYQSDRRYGFSVRPVTE